jgi:NADH dehydrogenase FAD-containing subunit
MRLVLLGGGHAHVRLLAMLRQQKLPYDDIVLVANKRYSYYSGMVSGYIEGTYAREDIRFDLQTLCEQAAVTWREETVTAIDRAQKHVITATGTRIPYDIASLNVGSIRASLAIPGAHEGVSCLKTAASFEHTIQQVCADVPIALVGGGAAGIEIALSIVARRQRYGMHAPVSLVTRHGLLPHAPAHSRNRIVRYVRTTPLRLHTAVAVTAIEARPHTKRLHLDNGNTLDAHHVVWLTGPHAPAWLRQSHLACDAHGYVRTRPTLQLVDDDEIFAVGDCRSYVHAPDLPKAGVYPVYEAPILWRNLVAMATQRASATIPLLETFSPRPRYVSIVHLGAQHAAFLYGNIIHLGTLSWKIKQHIDRRFMDQVRTGKIFPSSRV